MHISWLQQHAAVSVEHALLLVCMEVLETDGVAAWCTNPTYCFGLLIRSCSIATALPLLCSALPIAFLQWLDECIRHHQTMQQAKQQQQDAAAGEPQLFAPVVGAGLEQERERSAKAAAERQVAGGVSLQTVCLGVAWPILFRPLQRCSKQGTTE